MSATCLNSVSIEILISMPCVETALKYRTAMQY